MTAVTASAEVIHWRGPSPYYFAVLPADASATIAAVASAVSYGWGAIAATAVAQGFTWQTSIFPKDGGYVVPLKRAVRERITAEVGTSIEITVTIDG